MVCPLCFLHEKSGARLFLFCFIFDRVWNQVLAWMGIAGFPISSSVLDHFSNCHILFAGRTNKEFRMLFWYSIVWSMWLARNVILFKGDFLKENELIYSIKICSWNWSGLVVPGLITLAYYIDLTSLNCRLYFLILSIFLY